LSLNELNVVRVGGMWVEFKASNAISMGLRLSKVENKVGENDLRRAEL
jgi:hypothetical protein